ncbi:HAD-IB family hydrolase [Prevotella veroralis]|uniref:HAD-IB family hydrolase n=1 Tax=Prevotella veroralis TaxID=28137 RepID=UPI0003A773B4|nr:HAD-IB family hydrolase [Prevotella veroralis]
MMVKKVYAFDFDGTLTTKDTLLEFIRFARGNTAFLFGFLLFSPLLVLMKLKIYPNWKAKQRVFSWFFKGMLIDDFNHLCTEFALHNKQLLRPKGMKAIKKAIEEGSQVVIISASIDNWVRPFFDEMGNNIIVVGTKIEVSNNYLTGKFITNNCYGVEKVRRLQALFPQRETYTLIAFGDSRGDKELLAYANQGFYKPFRESQE